MKRMVRVRQVRAGDIAAMGGQGLLVWKQEWEQGVVAAEKLAEAQQRAEAMAAERQGNLGYALYQALGRSTVAGGPTGA